MNRSRRAKTCANQLIKSTLKKDKSASSKVRRPKAVVKVDSNSGKKTIKEDSGPPPFDENEAESTDSDYRDSSDEEYARSKKKRRKGKTSPQVRAKKVQSKSLKVYDRNSQHPRVAIEPSPVQLSFYRFICMWVVPFPSPSVNVPKTVVCKRKFEVLEESLDHLVEHHIAKLKSSKQPLKCCWEGCSANEREFETAEELCTHVKIHAEEKRMHFHG